NLRFCPSTKHRPGARPRVPGGSGPLPEKLFRVALVLPWWECFLIQMSDLDRYLEGGLREILDPGAASGAPRRRRRTGSGLPLLAVIKAPIELVGDAMPAVEPVAVQVQPIHLLP